MESVAVIVAAALIFLLLTYRGRAILRGVFYAFSNERREDFAMADELDRTTALEIAESWRNGRNPQMAKRWAEPSARAPHPFNAVDRRMMKYICAVCGMPQESHSA